jgi:SnoaL-like domain
LEANLEENRAIAIAFVEAIPGGKINPEHLTQDFDCWNASMGGRISGPTYLKGIAAAAATLQDMKMTVEGTVAEVDDVAVRARSDAVLPDGRIYANNYHFRMHFAGGKIQHIDAYLNTKTAEEMLMPLLWGDQRTFD